MRNDQDFYLLLGIKIFDTINNNSNKLKISQKLYNNIIIPVKIVYLSLDKFYQTQEFSYAQLAIEILERNLFLKQYIKKDYLEFYERGKKQVSENSLVKKESDQLEKEYLRLYDQLFNFKFTIHLTRNQQEICGNYYTYVNDDLNEYNELYNLIKELTNYDGIIVKDDFGILESTVSFIPIILSPIDDYEFGVFMRFDLFITEESYNQIISPVQKLYTALNEFSNNENKFSAWQVEKLYEDNPELLKYVKTSYQEIFENAKNRLWNEKNNLWTNRVHSDCAILARNKSLS